MACTFDKNLKVLSGLELDSLDYQRVNRMRRIRGEEIMILGCNKHFSFVENEKPSNQLKEINKLQNVHTADIVDFEMWDKYLYSRGDRETDIKVTEFGKVKPVEAPPKIEILPPQDPKPVVFKSSKYEKFKRLKIDCSFIKDSFEKVAVAAKGTRVYAGGKGLFIFEKDPVDEAKYKVLNYEGNENKRFFGLKAARSGHVIMQEATSNDLVVADFTGEEQMRHKGTQKAQFDATIARNPHFSGEVDSILWFCGTTSIGIVSLQDLSYNEIKNFLPTYGTNKDGIAIRGIMKDGGKSILVLFIVENQNCLAFLGDGNQEPDIYFVEDILPKYQTLMDLELSLDKQTVFCGGNTVKSQTDPSKKSVALLTALNFHRDLKVLDEMELVEHDPTMVFCIKRANKEDIIFAGCMKSVFILEFKNRKFTLLMIAIDLHSHFISDMCVFGSKLYTVGRKDKFISILHFDFEI